MPWRNSSGKKEGIDERPVIGNSAVANGRLVPEGHCPSIMNDLKYDETEVRVRFSEVDSWGMVWHGHYISWFEVGRTALLRKFRLLPQDLTRMGYVAPVVDLKCVYQEPARPDEEILIRTTVLRPRKAALTFNFQILRKSDRKLLAKGEETQVLLTSDGRMLYYLPPSLSDRLKPLLAYLEDAGSPA
jgi:acyl-CoA thioester hydrolase